MKTLQCPGCFALIGEDELECPFCDTEIVPLGDDGGDETPERDPE